MATYAAHKLNTPSVPRRTNWLTYRRGNFHLPVASGKIMQTRNKNDGQQAVGGGNGCVASFNRQMWQCHLLPKSAQPKKGAGVGA